MPGLKEGFDEEFLDDGHHCLSDKVKAAGNIKLREGYDGGREEEVTVGGTHTVTQGGGSNRTTRRYETSMNTSTGSSVGT